RRCPRREKSSRWNFTGLPPRRYRRPRKKNPRHCSHQANQAPTAAALPKGFRFAATACGLKKTGALPLPLRTTHVPASAAAAFTQLLGGAAPVVLTKKHLAESKGRMRAVVVNAGNANCAAGTQGDLASLSTVEETSKRLGLPAHEVFV